MLLKMFFFTILVCMKAYAGSYQLMKPVDATVMDIYEISQKLAPHGFYEVDLKRKGHIFKTPMDQLYLNTDMSENKAILILDLKFDSNERVLQISDTEFVCHGQTSRDRYFALYLKVSAKNEFVKICNSFSKVPPVKEVSSFKFLQLYKLLIRPAFAADGECGEIRNPQSSLLQLKTTIDNSAVIQGLGTCLSEALRGSGQTFSGMKDSLVTLLTNPLELWNEVAQQAVALKNFLVHLKDEVVLLKNSFSNLDPELVLQLGCHLGGEILTSIGIASLTGAGVVKLSATLAQAILKLKGMQSLLTRLNQLKKAGQGHFAKEVLNCVTTQ